MTATIDHVVTLTSVRNEMEAGIILAALEEQGIRATMTGVFTAEFRAEVPGRVYINVLENDFDCAEQILDRMTHEQEQFDWSNAAIDQTSELPAASGIGSLKVWRRIARALIAICFVSLAVGLATSVLHAAINSILDLFR